MGKQTASWHHPSCVSAPFCACADEEIARLGAELRASRSAAPAPTTGATFAEGVEAAARVAECSDYLAPTYTMSENARKRLALRIRALAPPGERGAGADPRRILECVRKRHRDHEDACLWCGKPWPCVDYADACAALGPEHAGPGDDGSGEGGVTMGAETCAVIRGNDCDGVTEGTCFRCGMPACVACSIEIDYRSAGMQRIGLDCLDEMARFGELDHLTLSVQSGASPGDTGGKEDGK